MEKRKMKRLSMIAGLVALFAVQGLWGQEFGGGQAAEVAVVEQGAGVQVVVEAQETVPLPASTAEQQINDLLNSREDWVRGYDEEKNRIIVVQKIDFDIKNPEVSTDFINLRTEKMSELLITAKAQIIETIFSKMSGERILEVPGNPIAKQMEKEIKEIKKQLDVSARELANLDKDLAESMKAKDSMTMGEIMATISSWFTSKDKENYAAKLDADKKERYENLKKDYEEAQKAYSELSQKAEELKGTISKQLKTTISKVAAMPIFGCTILQQAESVTNRNGKYRYQIAIMYCWSNEMQNAAAEILQGRSVKFKPGKKTINEWLKGKADNGALAAWVGPRNYIDKNGDMWFIGIAAAPTDDDDDTEQANREMAELEASAEVMFALYADASSTKTLEKVMQTKRIDSVSREAETKIYKDYSKTQSESFKNIHISNLSKIYDTTVRQQCSGLDIQVVVYGVNSGSVKALRDIQKHAYALGVEVNTTQQYYEGYVQGMKGVYDAAKDNQAVRNAGRNAGSKQVATEAAKLTEEHNKQKAASQENKPATAPKGKLQETTQPAKGNNKGQLKTGSVIIIDEDLR